MTILSEILESYLTTHSPPEPSVLKHLAKETLETIPLPNMLSAHYQGRVLSIISRLIRPKTILEIGTYTGYSAICLAEGLQKGGKLHTIDSNESLTDIQRRYFKKAGISQSIISYVGEALNIIMGIEHTLDLVFVDADKKNYANYYDLVIPKTRSGGCIISDNTLWKGKVYDASQSDKRTKSMRDYNKKLKEDNRVESLILPIRDGLTISFVR